MVPSGFVRNDRPARAIAAPANKLPAPWILSIKVLSLPNALSQLVVIQLYNLPIVSLIHINIAFRRLNVRMILSLFSGFDNQSNAANVISVLKNFSKLPRNPNPPLAIFFTTLPEALSGSCASIFASLF